MKFLADMFAKPIAWLIAGAVAIAAIWIVVSMLTSGHQRSEQGKQDSRSAEALAETAEDAAATVIEQAGEEATVDQLVAATTLEIENAPSDKAAGDAARAAICRMPDYRSDPACRVQPVHPR